MLQLLCVNDIFLNCTDREIIDLGMGVAEHKLNREAVLAWIKEREIPLSRLTEQKTL